MKREHQGLLAFQFRDRIYHYQVLHFGGTCSAYYWTRLAAIILRFFHHFLYIYHFGMVFVDDFIFGLDPVAAPLQTSTLLLCCAFLNIPLSWHKLELGHQITWIGWRIDAWSDTVSIPEEKMSKLLRNLRALTTAGKFKRSDVEAVAGHLLWISEIFPFFRWSLGTLYTILSRPGIQLVRLNKEQIKSVLSSLTDSGQMSVFLQRPYIPQGSILSRMGKLQFHPGNVSQFAQSCFDLNFAWASFWNCRSNRVQIFEPEEKYTRCTPLKVVTVFAPMRTTSQKYTHCTPLKVVTVLHQCTQLRKNLIQKICLAVGLVEVELGCQQPLGLLPEEATIRCQQHRGWGPLWGPQPSKKPLCHLGWGARGCCMKVYPILADLWEDK